ncbi:hypothetical protein [Acuticoccus yangtzensis]|uniref:hypothetical protein n=1 Tax=Acuticoccus yangtzensis TaxID=1443441 RepID=UPI0009498C24|nr:hypothetical protein [Acuticoccus yangtzensis]
MPIGYLNVTAVCEGVCTVDEAGPLLNWLNARRVALVDLGEAAQVHTAIVQVLLATNAIISAAPRDPLLCEVLAPALERSKQARPGSLSRQATAPVREPPSDAAADAA